MAEMAGAFLNDKLAGHLAITQHGYFTGIFGHLDGGGASFVAGGFGFFINDIIGTLFVDEGAAGHQFDGVAVAALLHGAFDGDEKIFLHGFSLYKYKFVLKGRLSPTRFAGPLTRPDLSVATRHLPTLWGVTLPDGAFGQKMLI